MTYLELCRKVYQEAGYGREVQFPSTASPASAGDDVLLVTEWVRRAWRQIQQERDDWRFMRRTFRKTLGPDDGTDFTPEELIGTGDPFRLWLLAGVRANPREWTLRDARETPPRAAGALLYVDWPVFRERYADNDGTHSAGRPLFFSIQPDYRISISPAVAPETRWEVEGDYVRATQELEADGDVPVLPAQDHTVIVWRAVLMALTHQEAPMDGPTREYNTAMSSLLAAQTPGVQRPRALV